MENNIDKIFRSKLATHQEKPSEDAWVKLEQAMYGKQINRRNRAIYWQVAAAVALLLVSSFFYFEGKEENSLATTIEHQQQKKEKKQPLQKTEIAVVDTITVETYYPIIETVKKQEKQNLMPEKQDKKVVAQETNLSKKTELLSITKQNDKVENEDFTKIEIKESVASNVLIEEKTPKSEMPEQEEIRVTVKFVEEGTENLLKEKEIVQEKKTWIGKMFANIKKKRQREKAEDARESKEEEKEKAGVFVFGIDTDKIFAKKKSGE